MSDESRAKATSDNPAPELTDDGIHRLLRNADRLSFGTRGPAAAAVPERGSLRESFNPCLRHPPVSSARPIHRLRPQKELRASFIRAERGPR